MPVQLDPVGVELREILAFVDLAAARVLEIGTGNGRLTYRYAAQARSVIAFDASHSDIVQASQNCPAALCSRVHFLCASATKLPFRDLTFDVVLLASAL